MIKAIIFDMGGVLVDLNPAKCLEEFHKLGTKDIDGMIDPYYQRGYVHDLEDGDMGEDEFVEKMAAISNPGTTGDDIRRALLAILERFEPYKADLILELAKTYPIYLLSNNNPIVMKGFDEWGRPYGCVFSEVMTDMFISYKMHLLKPGKEIYEEAVRRTGLKAEEILFIDDSINNVNGAKAVGIRAVLYEQGSDLRALIMGELG